MAFRKVSDNLGDCQRFLPILTVNRGSLVGRAFRVEGFEIGVFLETHGLSRHATWQICSITIVFILPTQIFSYILITNSIRPIMSNPPKLGPNPPGFCPRPWGLLDFQDIAIFYWLDLREFGLEEQCLILKHRNARLKDKMPEELERIEERMSNSDNINIEGGSLGVAQGGEE